jgi:CRP-like cAMP-binding protein
MQRHSVDVSPAAIESRVRELVGRERRLTFTTLAAMLSDCRWISLLRALNRLEQQQVVRLTPLPWDYEICVATNAPPAPGTK